MEKYQGKFSSELFPAFDELKDEKLKQKSIERKQILDKLLQQEKACQAEFQSIYQQISNSQISLPEMKKVYDQMGQIYEHYPNFRPSEKVEKLLDDILGKFANRLGDFRVNWLEKKTIKPTDEELDLFEFFVEKLFSLIYEETTNEEEKKQTKKEFDQLINTIHEEKKKRELKTSGNVINDNSGISKKAQDSQNLSQQISELESKVRQLEQEKQQSSDSELENKIKDLQSQIKILQNELEKTKKSSDGRNKVSKNIFGGKTSAVSGNSQPEKGFNWLYVVIPGGILLVIAGIIFAYLLGKKNKKE